MLDMRPATLADADMLYEWANDPVTRSMSMRGAHHILREDHDNWMKFNVLQGYPQHIVMIADTEHGSGGVVRFDTDKRDTMRHRVSITIGPKFRGLRLARGVLAEACRLMHETTLVAEIKKGNARSIAIFERCGFEQIGESSVFLHYERKPLS